MLEHLYLAIAANKRHHLDLPLAFAIQQQVGASPMVPSTTMGTVTANCCLHCLSGETGVTFVTIRVRQVSTTALFIFSNGYFSALTTYFFKSSWVQTDINISIEATDRFLQKYV